MSLDLTGAGPWEICLISSRYSKRVFGKGGSKAGWTECSDQRLLSRSRFSYNKGLKRTSFGTAQPLIRKRKWNEVLPAHAVGHRVVSDASSLSKVRSNPRVPVRGPKPPSQVPQIQQSCGWVTWVGIKLKLLHTRQILSFSAHSHDSQCYVCHHRSEIAKITSTEEISGLDSEPD